MKMVSYRWRRYLPVILLGVSAFLFFYEAIYSLATSPIMPPPSRSKGQGGQTGDRRAEARGTLRQGGEESEMATGQGGEESEWATGQEQVEGGQRERALFREGVAKTGKVTGQESKVQNDWPEDIVSDENDTISEAEEVIEEDWKTVLLWDKWFGLDWSERFEGTKEGELRETGCPTVRCLFTYDRHLFSTAHAVLFRFKEYPWQKLSPLRPYGQVWAYVMGEAPSPTPPTPTNTTTQGDQQIDWLMSYHPQADVVASYGFFISLNDTQRPLRPNLMSSHSEAVENIRRALDEDVAKDVGEGMAEDIVPGLVKNVVLGAAKDVDAGVANEVVGGIVDIVDGPRAHVVAWMVSSCRSRSKREEYVWELARHITIHTYGKCGKLKCPRLPGESPLGGSCWEKKLRHNYSFYLAFENSLCPHYLTEKAYNPLAHYVVPVVWGGSDYSQYLPPHSYIDAREYLPQELAALLLRLHNNPTEYNRYHIWRQYLKPVLGGSMCELCHRLHHQNFNTHLHHHHQHSNTRPLHHHHQQHHQHSNYKPSPHLQHGKEGENVDEGGEDQFQELDEDNLLGMKLHNSTLNPLDHHHPSTEPLAHFNRHHPSTEPSANFNRHHSSILSHEFDGHRSSSKQSANFDRYHSSNILTSEFDHHRSSSKQSTNVDHHHPSSVPSPEFDQQHPESPMDHINPRRYHDLATTRYQRGHCLELMKPLFPASWKLIKTTFVEQLRGNDLTKKGP